MIWNSPYLLLLNTSSLISIGLVIYALRYRQASGALPFIGLMLCALIWTGGYSLEIASRSLQTKVFWLNVQQIGIFGSPIAWLTLAFQAYGVNRFIDRKYMIPISILPILAVLLIWTNDWHGAMRHDVYLAGASSLSVVKTVRTPLSLFFIGYSYLLLILSLSLFIASFRRAPFPYRGQHFILMISLFLPMGTMLLDLFDLNPFAPFGPTSTVFIFSGLLVAWGLFRYNLFKIWPIARDKVFEEIQAGIIVTDTLGKMLDINPAAYHIFKQTFYKSSSVHLAIGEPLVPLLNEWPGWSNAYNNLHEHQLEVPLDSHVYYEVKISLLKNKNGRFIGHLTFISDITERKQTEKELLRQARTDFLTGILNRRYFMELSEQQYRMATFYEKPFSVIIMDIDHFKEINDHYGHNTGDLVLQQFTMKCKKIIRDTDIFGRIGGEEFAITLPETTIDGAVRIGEKIRRTLEQEIMGIDNLIIRITVSMGVTTKLEQDTSLESLLNRADDLLYKAKESRNCVMIQ